MPYGFSNKVGFCFLDIGKGDPNYNPAPTYNPDGTIKYPADSPDNFKYAGLVAPRRFFHDSVLQPTQPCLNNLDGTPAHPWGVTDKVDMGISAGWRDVYEATLPFQYVDVSDATPGWYWIRSEVDPNNLLREAAGKETNAAAFSTKASVVPGYIAKPVNAGQISGVKEATSKITLSSTKFRQPGRPAHHRSGPVQDHRAARARDARGPRPALPTRTAGSPPATSSTRRPAPTTAATPSSTPPVRPAASSRAAPQAHRSRCRWAAVTGCTTVGINGAPGWVYTGAAVQLGALIVPSGDVTWRAGDTVGGHPGVGTISATGLYRAPATVPDGRQGADHRDER